jgi:hypothetical protein
MILLAKFKRKPHEQNGRTFGFHFSVRFHTKPRGKFWRISAPKREFAQFVFSAKAIHPRLFR